MSIPTTNVDIGVRIMFAEVFAFLSPSPGGKMELDGMSSGSAPRPTNATAAAEWDAKNHKLFNLLAERVDDSTLLTIACRRRGKGQRKGLLRLAGESVRSPRQGPLHSLIGETIAMRTKTPEDTSRVVHNKRNRQKNFHLAPQ